MDDKDGLGFDGVESGVESGVGVGLSFPIGNGFEPGLFAGGLASAAGFFVPARLSRLLEPI